MSTNLAILQLIYLFWSKALNKYTVWFSIGCKYGNQNICRVNIWVERHLSTVCGGHLQMDCCKMPKKCTL